MSNQPVNTSRPPASRGTRVNELIVVREATMHGNEAMLGNITQTLKQWDHLPGVTDVLALGTDPIQQGEATLQNGKQLQLSVFNASNNRAVLFEHDGVMYLYAMGPTATRNTDFDDDPNAFVELLCDVLETYRPIHLNVATLSRLIRSSELPQSPSHSHQSACGRVELRQRVNAHQQSYRRPFVGRRGDDGCNGALVD